MNFEEAQFSSEEYWKRLNETQRARLIDMLSDTDERERIMTTERNLRIRVAKLDRTLEFDEIFDLVQRDIKLVRKFEEFADVGYHFVTTIFAIKAAKYFGVTGAVGSASVAAIGRLAKS